MKRFLAIITLCVLCADLYAVRLCKYGCAHKATLEAWNNSTYLAGTSDSGGGTGTASSSWWMDVTTPPAGTLMGESSCFVHFTNPQGYGSYCWCRTTSVNWDSECRSGWTFLEHYDTTQECGDLCPSACSQCVADRSVGNPCYSLVLWQDNTPDDDEVVCALYGECYTNPNYQIRDDYSPCGNNWIETNIPTLTIADNGTDDRGTYYYDTCTN